MNALRGARVLVTGGAGFIGTHLVRRLVSDGARVSVVDDLSGASSVPPGGDIQFHDVRLPNVALERVLQAGRFDVVLHLAGAAYVPPSLDDPRADLDQNAGVTVGVLEAVRRAAPAARLVFTSSAAVYGSPDHLPITEDTPIRPVSPYGVSKYAAEQYVSLYARLFGLRTAALRLFSVFGPGQRKQVIYDLIAKLQSNPRELPVYGTGDETRDFVYVDDVAAAAVTVAANGPLEGEVYNVASGTSHSIRAVVDAVATVMGLRPNIRFSGEVRPGDALRWEADVSCLRRLGYAPAVSLEQGIRRIATWFDEIAQEGSPDRLPASG